MLLPPRRAALEDSGEVAAGCSAAHLQHFARVDQQRREQPFPPLELVQNKHLTQRAHGQQR